MPRGNAVNVQRTRYSHSERGSERWMGSVRDVGEQDLETKKSVRCDNANDTGKTAG